MFGAQNSNTPLGNAESVDSDACAVGKRRSRGAASYCSSRRISSCSGTVSKVPVPAGICINGLASASSNQTLG